MFFPNGEEVCGGKELLPCDEEVDKLGWEGVELAFVPAVGPELQVVPHSVGTL